KGFIARIDLEHASGVTFSDYRYNRLFGEISAYTHFRYPSRDPRSQVLAGHLRIGFVRALASAQTGIELLHPRKRFYAGGSHSVRGYDENQLGPRILTIPPGDHAARRLPIQVARRADPRGPRLQPQGRGGPSRRDDGA